MVVKKKQQQQHQIDVTSIPKSIRRILAEWPIQEMRPVRLSKAVEELCFESRRNGIGDKQIRRWIIDRATATNWTNSQIDAILRDYKLEPMGSGGSGGNGGGGHAFEIEDIQKLMESLTGLEESDLLRAESRDELERKSKAFILKTVVPLKEYDINHWLAQFRKLGTVIDVYSESLSRRKMELKRSVITE